MAENKQIILWLDDRQEEIRDEANDLERANYEVTISRDIVVFRNEVEELAQDGRTGDLRLVILDIMLEGVAEIITQNGKNRSATTSNGYAAGLVFLEQVIAVEPIYEGVRRVPIVLNSKRAISAPELQRIEAIKQSAGIEILVFEKTASQEISHYLSDHPRA